ncbi:MAG: phosphoribosylformylglycinamidine cyclo-ligase [bacterium]
MTEITYKNAGVNRALGDKIKDSIEGIVQNSYSEQVLKGIGLFSGFYVLDLQHYKQPVLVASIDGVGTKVKIAQMMGVHSTIGEDLVNHCVNDIMVCGAEPLFFLDYIAADKLEGKMVREIISGISNACKCAGCALIGGETAEMPEVYTKNNFDIAGSIVGVVEKDAIIDGSKIEAGDVLIGIASNGLHTNGFSLVRKIFFGIKNYKITHYFEDLQSSLGEELLKIHRSYRVLIQKVRNLESLHGIAHITGGGIIGNTSRLLKKDLSVHINWSVWEKPPIFNRIQTEGNISNLEMQQVFNLGIGLVLIVKKESVDHIFVICESTGEKAYLIGSIIQKEK